MEVLDELCNVDRTRVITLSDTVASKACLSRVLACQPSTENDFVAAYQLIDQGD